MWDTIVSGKVWRGVLVNRRKDGTLYDEQMTITPVAAANGEVDHFVAIKQDVTERRRAEAALAESEERLRTLFENAPVGIGVADVQGHLLAYNDAMLKPGGYTRADVPIGFNVAALYAEPAQREEILSLAREQGYVREYEAQFKRKDGSHYTAL